MQIDDNMNIPVNSAASDYHMRGVTLMIMSRAIERAGIKEKYKSAMHLNMEQGID